MTQQKLTDFLNLNWWSFEPKLTFIEAHFYNTTKKVVMILQKSYFLFEIKTGAEERERGAKDLWARHARIWSAEKN